MDHHDYQGHMGQGDEGHDPYGDEHHLGHDDGHEQQWDEHGLEGHEDHGLGHEGAHGDEHGGHEDGEENNEAMRPLVELIAKLLSGELGQHTHQPKPTHAHSRFAQDPHHHKTMRQFHKIASEDVHDSHIESFIHIGTLLLARAAKQIGMTAGHEESDDEGDDDHHQQQQHDDQHGMDHGMDHGAQ